MAVGKDFVGWPVRTDFDDHLYEVAVNSSTDPNGFMKALDAVAHQRSTTQADGTQAGPDVHHVSEIPLPAKVSGLSKGMSLIRSPHQGP